MKVIKPPHAIEIAPQTSAVFLAGSIDMGQAIDWQAQMIQALSNLPITFLNPRRDDWDTSWEQSIDNPAFNEQVQWELDGLEKADHIVMYFAPESKAPITLLELGLFAHSHKLIVCCPDGFWRKGNVDIVCRRYGISQVADLNAFINIFKSQKL